MKPSVSVSVASLIASGTLGVDVMMFDETIIEPRVDEIAGELVEIKQVDDTVKAIAPWKDQPGLEISYDFGEPTFTERVTDKRKKGIIYEQVDFGDGGFKIDILLTEKPDTNRFCYTIQNHENYDFFYQPPLTAEEIAQGAYRPPEIEGSYAVYHKTLRDHIVGRENYATGKVMHIPRPQVWELDNEEATKRWADLSYEDGQLCVTAPQDFIDNADYSGGVRIDPTFGYTSQGASNWDMTDDGSDGRVAMRGTSISGDLTEIAAYLLDDFTFGDSNYRFVLSAESGGFPGSTFVVDSGVVNISNTSFELKTYSTSYTMASNNWWVQVRAGAVGAGTNGANIAFDSGSGDAAFAFDSLGGAWTSSTNRFSVYATYTTGGPSATTTPTVTTGSATGVGATGATLNGTITDDGNAAITQHGFAFGTVSTLSGGDTATSTLGSGSEGAFSEVKTGLNPQTTYYFRAYGTNASGTVTGTIQSFTTGFAPDSRINTGTIRINTGRLDL